ncbi:6003_t:CDS:2 [Paraglomus brasilianum]|uniref:6003_t:CDS:1 n=1 Tax=Paraglomus brasilianum TaxID=144538 RepID=A0A9N8YXV5_9GLOM|nr:6003_t:CDS:2 [Paraglomus brasilianum]
MEDTGELMTEAELERRAQKDLFIARFRSIWAVDLPGVDNQKKKRFHRISKPIRHPFQN